MYPSRNLSIQSDHSSMFPVPPRKSTGRRSLFNVEEDAKLTRLVEACGEEDWRTIAREMPDRTARQCRDRWQHYLSPTVSHEPFTPDEDGILLTKYTEVGPRWKTMMRFFRGRTPNDLKNRWERLNSQTNRRSATRATTTPIKVAQQLPPITDLLMMGAVMPIAITPAQGA
jgi:hypothetical protein